MAIDDTTTIDPRIDQTRDRDRQSRTAQEELSKSTYYRPEYGWIMSDAQVEAEKEIEKAYTQRTKDAQSVVDKASSDYQASKKDSERQIAAEYDEQIRKLSSDLVPVRVVNGNTVEATYLLSKSTVNSMDTTSLNQKGGYTGNWVDNGAYYNIDVRAGGGARGSELHTSLITAANNTQKLIAAQSASYEKQKQKTIAGFDASAEKQYAGQKAVWDKELGLLSNAYSTRLSTGKQQYEDSIKEYNKSLSGLDTGLLETPTSGVKTTDSQSATPQTTNTPTTTASNQATPTIPTTANNTSAPDVSTPAVTTPGQTLAPSDQTIQADKTTIPTNKITQTV